MSVVNVITWTCACVFICTAIITLLSVLDLIKIDPKFREKLFYALLVEIVATSVLVFKNNVTATHLNLIRITNPSDQPNQTTLTHGTPLFVIGVCKKDENTVFNGVLEVNHHVYNFDNFKIGQHDVFAASTVLKNDTTLGLREGKAVVKLMIKGEVVSADSVTFDLLIK